MLLNKDKIISIFGGVGELSKRYGVTKNAIYMWPSVVGGLRANHINLLAYVHGIDISDAIIDSGCSENERKPQELEKGGKC